MLGPVIAPGSALPGFGEAVWVSFDVGVQLGRSQILGMRRERMAIQTLLRDGRRHGAALRLTGSYGAGKSTLLGYAAKKAYGARLVSVQGSQAERELPLAGTNLVIGHLRDHLPRLHATHRGVLEVTAGIVAGQLAGTEQTQLALVELLRLAGAVTPLVVLIDDAQWLDAESAACMAYVARRLAPLHVALLVAESAEHGVSQLGEVDEIAIGPLDAEESEQLLLPHAGRSNSTTVIDRIVAESRGNPRALLAAGVALGAGYSAALDQTDPLHPAVRPALKAQAALPEGPRSMLLVAAAEPTGDPMLVWDACRTLGVEQVGVDVLQDRGLLTVGERVLFPSPSVRAALYGASSSADRRRVHRALASAIEPSRDEAERLWHLALATSGLDDRLAFELERAATRSRRSGATANSAALLQASALMTSELDVRADRALAAARTHADIGSVEAAQRLLSVAEMGPYSAPRSTFIAVQRCRVLTDDRVSVRAANLMAAAVRALPYDVAQARECALEALVLCFAAGDTISSMDRQRLGEGGSGLCSKDADTHQPVQLLLKALSVRAARGFEASVPSARAAIVAFCDPHLEPRFERWLPVASFLAADLWDDVAFTLLNAAGVGIAGADAGGHDERRDANRYRMARRALATRHEALLGLAIDIPGGRSSSVTEECIATLRAAWVMEPVPTGLASEALLRQATRAGDARSVAILALAAGLRANAAGNYEAGLEALVDAGREDHPGLSPWIWLETAEAASRSNRPDLVESSAQRLIERVQAPSSWAGGVAALSRALLEGHADSAESFFLGAISRLSKTSARAGEARANLIYGEWLRRRKRRHDARIPLRSAHDCFTELNAQGFAERAAKELLATGQTARPRSPAHSSVLTPQEMQTAYLARDGLSNPEIGSRLFVSPRTAEYHLRKVFSKLGISSRNELHLVLPTTDLPVQSLAGEPTIGSSVLTNPCSELAPRRLRPQTNDQCASR